MIIFDKYFSGGRIQNNASKASRKREFSPEKIRFIDPYWVKIFAVLRK